MSTVDGSVWDDEWMRRIEQAEDGAATASAVMALYDSLMSHDDVPSRGVGCLIGRQYRLARLASLPSAPARMLADMAAVLVDGAGSKEFDDLAFPVVYALGDNQALPCAAYDGLERAYGGDGGVCPELGVRNPVYANRVARRTILGNPAGCVAYVPERTLQAVREGIVTDRDVLAYLGEGVRQLLAVSIAEECKNRGDMRMVNAASRSDRAEERSGVMWCGPVDGPSTTRVESFGLRENANS